MQKNSVRVEIGSLSKNMGRPAKFGGITICEPLFVLTGYRSITMLLGLDDLYGGHHVEP
jgi:hypothetical protein